MRRMRSDARCRRRRAVSEGAVVARELGGGGHGGSALVRPEREREREGTGQLWRSFKEE
jgi:hypothetical protein